MDILHTKTFKAVDKGQIVNSNESLIKGTLQGLKHFYQGVNPMMESNGIDSIPKDVPKEKSENKSKKSSKAEHASATITLLKRVSIKTQEAVRLKYQSIEEALLALRGDIWVSELLLVITPDKETIDTTKLFEIHGIDKIYKQFLGTIYINRDELRQLEESGKFDNYSMVFVNTPIDPKTCLEFLVGQCEDPGEIEASTGTRRNRTKPTTEIVKQESEPTFHVLLQRLEGNTNTADLTKFFDFAEKYNFSTIIRPDFVNFSNKLRLDFFIFHNHYVGSLSLTNSEISDQIERHPKLMGKITIVEDTNELLISKKTANFLKRLASCLGLLYVYDYMSEFIYKIYNNI